MALNYVTITETFKDGSGTALAPIVTFTPSETVYSAGNLVATPNSPVVAKVVSGALKAADGVSALQLLATDNTGLTYLGQTGYFEWAVNIDYGGGNVQTWSFFLPAALGTADLYKLANTLAGGGRIAPSVIALTDGATISVDSSLGNDFRVTLGGNRTISNPVNPADGQMIVFELTQDATGGRAVTWGSAFAFGATGQPTLSTSAAKTDQIGFKYNAAKAAWLFTGSTLGF